MTSRRRGNDQQGFTLLEFLVAVAILSVGLLGMGTLTGAVMNYNREAYNGTKAVALAQDKMEDLRNLSYQTLSGLTGGSDTDSIYTRTWTISANVPVNDMATITVTVAWDWKGTSKSVQLKSIVGR